MPTSTCRARAVRGHLFVLSSARVLGVDVSAKHKEISRDGLNWRSIVKDRPPPATAGTGPLPHDPDRMVRDPR